MAMQRMNIRAFLTIDWTNAPGAPRVVLERCPGQARRREGGAGDRDPGPRRAGRADGGNLLAATFFAAGRHVQSFATYGGARRGTPVSSFIRVDERPVRVRCDIERADAILCFDATLLEGRLLATAHEGTFIVVNSGRSAAEFARLLPGYRVLPIDAIGISRTAGLGRIVNSALLGAFARALGAPPLAALERTIAERSPQAHAGEPGGLPRRLAGRRDGVGGGGGEGGGACRRRPRTIPRRGGLLLRAAIAGGRRMNGPIPPIWTTATTESIRTGTWRAALPPPRAGAVALPRRLPGERRHRVLDRPRARRRLPRRVERAGPPQPVPRHRGTHLPSSLRARVQSRRFRRGAVDLQLERFVGDHAIAAGWTFDDRGRAAARARGHRRRRAGRPVGRVPAASPRVRRDDRRGPRCAGRADAPRHPLLSPVARRARRRDRAHRRARRERSPGDRRWTRRAPGTALRASHDAVLWPPVRRRQKRLPSLDYGEPWVADGAAWLRAANEGRPPALGRRVVVVGGGSAALDAARSAARAPATRSRCSRSKRARRCRRKREEVDEALEEGVGLVDGGDARRGRNANARRRAASRACASGSSRPRRAAVHRDAPAGQLSSIFTPMRSSTSIGQDRGPRRARRRTFASAGPLLAVDEAQATQRPGTWAGGDVASMARFVTDADRTGQARRIRHRPFTAGSETATCRPAESWRPGPSGGGSHTTPSCPSRPSRPHRYPRQARATSAHLDAATRVASSDEVQLPLDVASALAEADALLLLRHVHHVATPAWSSAPTSPGAARADGYRVLGDYCKGCGLCVKECPTGVHGHDRGGALNGPATTSTRPPARLLLTGNEAVAWGARLARPQVCPVYPITPQTPVARDADRVPGGRRASTPRSSRPSPSTR